MTQSADAKWMTPGEAGLGALAAVSAFVFVFVAAKANDAPFAFHALLFAAFSLWACFAIFNRYYARPAALPAQEIDGRPNYNLGPIKFASAIAMFWGIAGFLVGLIIASQLAWPATSPVCSASDASCSMAR